MRWPQWQTTLLVALVGFAGWQQARVQNMRDGQAIMLDYHNQMQKQIDNYKEVLTNVRINIEAELKRRGER